MPFFNSLAFVEFKDETTARNVKQKKQGVKIQGRVLILDFVGETSGAHFSQVTKANDDNNVAVKGKSLAIFVGGFSKDILFKF